jgi:2-polyprenyl-3-methyl-5-hydroxy-6-metoxy-1,4-benzoquinol methylase
LQVKYFYDNIAKDYHHLRYGNEYYRKVAQLELDFIKKYLQGKSCIEVGSGTGRVTEFLLANGKHVMAIDISPHMLEEVKMKFQTYQKLTTKALDIYKLHIINGFGGFDFVICLRVLSHLKDPLAALKQLKGAVKNNGIVIFDIWNAWGYNAIAKRLKLTSSAVFTWYKTIHEMYDIIGKSKLLVKDKRGFGFPPFKFFLPLEKSSFPLLDVLSQRIIWVCTSQKSIEPK